MASAAVAGIAAAFALRQLYSRVRAGQEPVATPEELRRALSFSPSRGAKPLPPSVLEDTGSEYGVDKYYRRD